MNNKEIELYEYGVEKAPEWFKNAKRRGIIQEMKDYCHISLYGYTLKAIKNQHIIVRNQLGLILVANKTEVNL